MTLPPADDEGTTNDGTLKTRRAWAEGWALGVGLLILVGLLGHLLNQQQASKRTADTNVPSAPAPTAVDTTRAAEAKTEAPQRSPRSPEIPKRSPVVYHVAHKHRLRDCHGTLTFTQEGLRFESDQPQDSFAVRLDEVTVDADALRIRNKTWRFEFDAGISAARTFHNWKAGTLLAVSSR